MVVRELITRLGYSVDPASEKRARGSIEGIKKVAGVLAAVFVTGKLAQGFRRMIDLAGDAAEVTSQLEATFEGAADSVKDFAATTADDVGRSRFALEQFAASTGAILKPMLGSAKGAAMMSTQIAKLSVDLASFFNTSDPEALRSLQSGLVGQTEPLLKFGIVMTQANLALFAQEQGIQKSLKAMTAAEKTQLRFNFIMAKTTDAQGDAARTSQSFSNQSKALESSLTDLQTEIGQELLPSATAFLQTMVTITREIKGPLVSAVRRARVVFGAFVKPLPLLAAGLTALVIGFKLLGAQAVISWLLAFAPMVLTLALIGLIGLAIFALIEDFKKMGDGGESVIGALVSEFQRLLDITGSVSEAVLGVLKSAFDFWAQKLGFDLKEINAGFEQAEETLKRLAALPRQAFGLLTGGGRFAQQEGLFGAAPLPGGGGAGGAGVTGGDVNVTVIQQPGESGARVAARTGERVSAARNRADRQLANQLGVGAGAGGGS